jgi:hypothetical protein
MEAHAERCLTSINPDKLAKVMQWFGERQGWRSREARQFIADGDLT